MAGPLVNVDTKTRTISLDISRKLNLGKNKVLYFEVPDPEQFSKWKILLTLDKGFDRISSAEKTSNDASEVIFAIADLNGAVRTIIGSKDLHVRLDNERWVVDDVPPVAPNVAQVFNLTCKTRTTRARYFESKKR